MLRSIFLAPISLAMLTQMSAGTRQGLRQKLLAAEAGIDCHHQDDVAEPCFW